MTKAELVEEVANQSELTKKDAEVIVQTVSDSITDSLQRGEKIELRGFGSFRIRNRSSRQGRNPKTGSGVSRPGQEGSLFQARQGNQGPDQPVMDRLWTPWRFDYINSIGSEEGCVFCRILSEPSDEQNYVLFRGKHCYVILNLFPYTSGHLLVVANRHISRLVDAGPEELPKSSKRPGAAKRRCAANISPTASTLGSISGAQPAPASNTTCTCTFCPAGPAIRILFPSYRKPASCLRNCQGPTRDSGPTSRFDRRRSPESRLVDKRAARPDGAALFTIADPPDASKPCQARSAWRRARRPGGSPVNHI